MPVETTTDHRGMRTTRCTDCRMMLILFDDDTHTCDTETWGTDDGDTFVYGGETHRVRIEHDDMTIMDEQGEGVWCGRIAWPYRNRETGRESRPSEFDGGAELIRPATGDNVWWQVPADLRGEENRERRDSVRSTIRDLLDWGYLMVGLERLETCDRGHTHVADATWLGGIEPFPSDEYVREILADHVATLAEVDV